MKIRVFFAFAACLFLLGCAVVDVTKTGKGFHEKTEASELEILKTRPEKSFEELGTVTVSGFAATETAKMHNAIRAKAAALGANAVILTEEGFLPGGFGGTGRKWANGVAIRYK